MTLVVDASAPVPVRHAGARCGVGGLDWPDVRPRVERAIKQWHNEPSEEYGGMRLGDFFEAFLDGQCRILRLIRDDLGAWRPEAKKRGKAGTWSKKAASSADDDEVVPDE